MLAPVNGDSATPAVSSEAATADSPVVLSLTELGKNSSAWTLTLHPSHLALAEAPDERPYVILREQVMKSAMLIEGMGAFALSKPRKVTFKLTPEATAALAEWIGKPVLAAFYLKRRYGWVLPVAVIWMIGSLPMPASPSAELEAKPFDLVGFGLGLTLVVSWAFAKWRPHPALFLVDSIWFLWLAGYLAVEVLKGRSQVWLVLVALLLWMAVTGFKHFARFRGTRLTRVST
jgi:hypothetical protein